MRKAELIDTLRRSYDGDAWHGPSFAEVVKGVADSQAAKRPPGNAHSIWELTLHLAAWSNEVARRLRDGEPRDPEEGDWPVTGGSWQEAVQRVFDARDRVLQAIDELTEADLDRRIGQAGNADAGTGFTYAGMIEGLAQHNTYHAGQIAILRRILRG